MVTSTASISVRTNAEVSRPVVATHPRQQRLSTHCWSTIHSSESSITGDNHYQPNPSPPPNHHPTIVSPSSIHHQSITHPSVSLQFKTINHPTYAFSLLTEAVLSPRPLLSHHLCQCKGQQAHSCYSYSSGTAATATGTHLESILARAQSCLLQQQ